MSSFNLSGRKALVTGGARGIGAGIAESLAAAGASVVIGDIVDDLGRTTAEKIGASGATAGFVHLDVTQEADWESAVSSTVEQLGGFDILVNNAGIEISALVIDADADDLRAMLDVNVVAAACILHLFAPGTLQAASRAERLGIGAILYAWRRFNLNLHWKLRVVPPGTAPDDHKADLGVSSSSRQLERLRMHRLGRGNIRSTAENGRSFRVGAVVAAFALAVALVGQAVSANAWGVQEGRLRIAASDADNTIVRLSWVGPIAEPMAQQIREVFEDRKQRATRFVLTLSSDGGSVAEGERVIEVLRRIGTTHALETVVPQGEKCASMCVFIYLQGQKRYGALTSSWLFHEVSRRDPITKQTTLDRAAWERLVDKYFRPAGVPEEWIANLKQRTVESDYWQTGADLVQSNSGIIHVPLGNQRARNVLPSPQRDEARSAQPQPGVALECKQYVASVGAVLTVPCSR